jgi:anti-sigma28 factor (negative regulator of flagellin synthesis)
MVKIAAMAVEGLAVSARIAAAANPPETTPIERRAPTPVLLNIHDTSRALAREGMPLDLERITALKNAIAEGQLSVSPKEIAVALLHFGKRG